MVKVAYTGANLVPIAVPFSCLKYVSLKHIYIYNQFQFSSLQCEVGYLIWQFTVIFFIAYKSTQRNFTLPRLRIMHQHKVHVFIKYKKHKDI